MRSMAPGAACLGSPPACSRTGPAPGCRCRRRAGTTAAPRPPPPAPPPGSSGATPPTLPRPRCLPRRRRGALHGQPASPPPRHPPRRRAALPHGWPPGRRAPHPAGRWGPGRRGCPAAGSARAPPPRPEARTPICQAAHGMRSSAQNRLCSPGSPCTASAPRRGRHVGARAPPRPRGAPVAAAPRSGATTSRLTRPALPPECARGR
mmetsp:Transcript_106618/g.301671  ORF Transcript_106618/g.301671 Transcript_106618/m.301671 type:complete len:206 (-) Transcript_106618:510-1127(-)